MFNLVALQSTPTQPRIDTGDNTLPETTWPQAANPTTRLDGTHAVMLVGAQVNLLALTKVI